MNLKKKILLGVGLLLFVVVIGVPAFLMFKGISQFGAAKDELALTVSSLRSYYKKNPFPTRDNIEKERENLKQMRRWFGELLNVVTAGQIEKRDATPSSFMTQYNQTRNKIITVANKSSELVSTDNAFGFDRYYKEGVLPVAIDVPRLMQQMMITERLAVIMVEANVKKINVIGREEFDSISSNGGTVRSRPSSSRRGRRGASPVVQQKSTVQREIRKTDVYEVQSFSVEFVAKEAVILDVLNRFACDDMFIVVTGVEFIKQKEDLRIPDLLTKVAAGGETGDNVKAAVTSGDLRREQRLVSGVNVDMPMTVHVNLDVYTFFVHKAKGIE